MVEINKIKYLGITVANLTSIIFLSVTHNTHGSVVTYREDTADRTWLLLLVCSAIDRSQQQRTNEVRTEIKLTVVPLLCVYKTLYCFAKCLYSRSLDGSYSKLYNSDAAKICSSSFVSRMPPVAGSSCLQIQSRQFRGAIAH